MKPPSPLRLAIARTVRTGRRGLGWTQQQLADRAGLSRSMVGLVESGDGNLTAATADRLFGALDQQVDLVVRQPFVDRPDQADGAHASCIGHVHRRLGAGGWEVRREVEVVHGRSHGWIDVLAFNPADVTLLIVEVKTEIRDLGRIERTLGWYAREARATAARFGWRPGRVRAWLLVLATAANEERLRDNQASVDQIFRGRGSEMLDPDGPATGIAMIDPRSRRRDWLLRARIHGRRSAAPYRNYADFMAHLGRGRSGAKR